MSCTNPSRMFDTGYLTEKGKPLYKYCSNKVDWIYKPSNPHDIYNTRQYYKDIIIKNYIEVPCGKCEACGLTYSKQWMQRCMLEAKQWKFNEMVTLTYNDDNLPKQSGIDPKTGEIREVSTLCKKDVEKFNKDLRKYWKYHYGEDNIRFYMCGEYGDQKGRPHYHILFFNLNVRDKEFHKNSDTGFPLYTSKILEKIWGKGWVQINEVNEETCAYVARYILKKQKGKGSKEYYKMLGKVPEYTNGSRKPGLAKYFYDEHKDSIYEYDKMVIGTNNGAQQIKPSKYYDRLFDIDEPDKMEQIKQRRKELAEQRQATLNKLSGLTLEQQREFKANMIHERLKKLERGLK